MIHVITLSTKVYNNYIPGLLDSLKNLFPKEEKTVHFISDIDHDSDELPEGVINGGTSHICHLPQSLCTNIKPYLVADKVKDLPDESYFIYVDADTIFLEKSDEFWDELIEDMNHFMVCRSPWMTHDWASWDIRRTHPAGPESSGFYPFHENSVYIQSSLLAGRLGEYRKFVREMHRFHDLDTKKDSFGKGKILPPFSEESYLNKLFNDYLLGSGEFDFVMNDYTVNDYEDTYFNDPEAFEALIVSEKTFAVQKFHGDIKEEIRFNILDNYEL